VGIFGVVIVRKVIGNMTKTKIEIIITDIDEEKEKQRQKECDEYHLLYSDKDDICPYCGNCINEDF